MTRAYAFGYVRQSKSRAEDDGDSLSCAAQEFQIRAYAQRHGYEIARVFSDQDFTGRTDKRPGFQELFSAIRAKQDPVHAVITYKFARFARKVRVFATYHGELQDRGIELLSTTESSDTRMVQMSALMADWYSTDLSEFVSAALRHKIRSGRWHGNIPVGYRKDHDTQRLAPDPEAGPIVTELFARYAAGASIVDLLHWVHDDPALATVREGRVWNRTTVHRLLARRCYLGHTSGHEDAHPPLVSPETFAVVARRRTHPQRRALAKAVTSPLEGMVTCGACGQPMRLTTVQRPDLPSGHSRFWRCGSMSRQYNYGEPVTPHQRIVRGDWIEAAVRRTLRQDLARLVSVDAALERARTAVRSDATATRRRALERERAKIATGRDRLLSLFRDGRLDADRWDVADREQATALARIDADLATLPAPPDPGAYQATYARLAGLRGRVVPTDDPELRRDQEAALRAALIDLDVRIVIDARPPQRGRARTAPTVTLAYGGPGADFLHQ